MARAVNVLSPEIISGCADGFKRSEGSMGYLEMAKDISAPGVEGNATVLQGNVRNLGDPCSYT